MNELFKYRLLSVDAWREGDGWTWNQTFATGIELEFTHWPTTREVLAKLREVEYFTSYSKGNLRVEEYGEGSFEVMWRGTGEPLCALERLEG